MKSVLFSNAAKISIFAFLSGVLVSGCNDLSVKEAQNVALDYKGKLFTPAPRELDEIFAKIKQYDNSKPVHPCYLCNREINEKSLSRKIKMNAKKGIALHRQGKTIEGLKYVNKALKLYEKKSSGQSIDSASEGQLFNILAQIHGQSGNYELALKYARHNASMMGADSKGRKGKLINIKSILTEQYAILGDVDAAEYAVRDAEELLHFLVGKKPEHRFRPIWEGKVEMAYGFLEDARGNLRKAESHYRTAIPWLKKSVPTKNMFQRDSEITIRGVRLVKNLIAQGRIAEADATSRSAVKRSLLVFGRNAPTTAKTIMGLAHVMMIRGRYDDVEKLASISRDIILRTGGSKQSPYYIEANNILAEASLAQYDYKKALGYFKNNIRQIGNQKNTLDRYINGNLNYAVSLLRADQLNKAKQVAQVAERRRRNFLGDEHPLVIETEVILNLIRIKQNQKKALINKALKQIPIYASSIQERLVQKKEAGIVQVRFIMVMEEFMSVLTDINQHQQYDNDLFAMSQMVQGQKVQRALSMSAARMNIRDTKLADLVRTEQDLSYKIKSAYDSLANFKPEQSEAMSARKQALQEKITQLEMARKSIRDEVADQFPEYEQLLRPTQATVALVQKALGSNEAMVSLYFGEQQSYAFAIPKSGVMKVEKLPISSKWVSDQVGKLRKTLDSGAQSIAEIPEYDVNRSYQLYRHILQPLKSVWSKHASMVLVTNGALASMPISALVTKPVKLNRRAKLKFSEYRKLSWLANTHNVRYLPSVMAVSTLKQVAESASPRKQFIGFGNPVFSASTKQVKAEPGQVHVRGLRKIKKGNLDVVKATSTKLKDLVQLPETELEVTEIAKVLKAKPEQSVFVGAKANEQNLKQMKLDDRKIIMFATHALIPGDLDGLEQPAIALSSPDVSKTNGDGLLTMEEVLGLKLNADWVVLSACNTGAASGKGADAISGLGMAFFYAGSRSLLVTHWPVETNSARALTTGLFESQQSKGLTRTEAIAQTVRQMISKGVYRNNGKAVFSYAHPMFWAPFTLIGDGGHKVL